MTAGLMLLSKPMIRLLYEWGQWDSFSTEITSRALLFLSIGMVGYGVQTVLSRAFYAVQNGRIPLLTGAVSILVNILLCRLLSDSMDVAGLALASSVSALVSALLLLLPMQRQAGGIVDRAFRVDLLKILLACVLMSAAVYPLRQALSAALPDGVSGRILMVLLPALAGVAVYLAAAWLLKISIMQKGLSAVKSRLRRKGEQR